MIEILKSLLHGGAIDGYKKFLGGALVLASKFIPDPEWAKLANDVGLFILSWGIASDTAKFSVK